MLKRKKDNFSSVKEEKKWGGERQREQGLYSICVQ